MTPERVLLLEDHPVDAQLVRNALEEAGYLVTSTNDEQSYVEALKQGGFGVIVADHSIPGSSAEQAVELARHWLPGVPVLCITGAVNEHDGELVLGHGAADYISKDQLWRLLYAIKRATIGTMPSSDAAASNKENLLILIGAIQSLSLAKNLDDIAAIIRYAARSLVNADGATFIIKERDLCYYADENAIAPLWKGQRFPSESCISGWAMNNRMQVSVVDIYQDKRIPHDAYRQTFVQSLVMTPVRQAAPIAAIGTYWAKHHQATAAEMQLLQMLADTTAVAIANVELFDEMEARVAERTKRLQVANEELRAFSYTVAHDLKSPLFGIHQISQLFLSQDNLDIGECRTILSTIGDDALRMADMTASLLKLYTLSLNEPICVDVDISAEAARIVRTLTLHSPQRQVDVQIEPGLTTHGDPALIDSLLENLIGNAWKYSARVSDAKIEVGKLNQAGPEAGDQQQIFFVRDNGAGFDMKLAGKLFKPFQRLHSPSDFTGMGIGLATASKIVKLYNGKIWAEAEKGAGATFFFTLPN
jgi:signal transduction histidine kinase